MLHTVLPYVTSSLKNSSCHHLQSSMSCPHGVPCAPMLNMCDEPSACGLWASEAFAESKVLFNSYPSARKQLMRREKNSRTWRNDSLTCGQHLASISMSQGFGRKPSLAASGAQSQVRRKEIAAATTSGHAVRPCQRTVIAALPTADRRPSVSVEWTRPD